MLVVLVGKIVFKKKFLEFKKKVRVIIQKSDVVSIGRCGVI